MTSILGLVFLVVLAIAGKYALDRINIKSLGFNFLVYSGFYYLVLGIILNPNLLNIFKLSILSQTEFFFNFILGWTGFLVGLQLNLKGVKRFPLKYYWFSLLHFIIMNILIILFLLMIKYFFKQSFSYLYIILFAIMGSMGSVLGIGLLVNNRSLRSINAYFLQFTTAFDNVLGILALGILFFVYQLTQAHFLQAILIYGFSYFVVVLLAYFYKYLDSQFKTAEEEMLLILGLILIVVGMARYLHNSILFLSFFLGVLIINMKVDTKKILMTVQEWEKPLNFILLFAIGLYLDFNIMDNALVWEVLILLLIAKYVGGYVLSYVKLHKKQAEKENRLLLFGMSSLSLPMALDAYFTNHSAILLKFLTVIVIGFYLTNFLVFYLVKEKEGR